MRAPRVEQHSTVGHGTMYVSVECMGPLRGSGGRVRTAPFLSSRVQTPVCGWAHLVKLIVSRPQPPPTMVGIHGSRRFRERVFFSVTPRRVFSLRHE